MNMANDYTGSSDFDEGGMSPRSKRGWAPERQGNYQSPRSKQSGGFTLGKLQLAGILLIVVFIWALVSALAMALFSIHVLALTEFADDGKADVSGYVTDSEGIPLVNVTVAIHGTHHFTHTNSEGFYTMEDIGEGNYEIEASIENYASVTKRVSLDANSPAMVNFQLQEGGLDKTINERYGSNISDLEHLNWATAVFILVYGFLALFGGILAYMQRLYWLTMLGALSGIVAGVFSIGIVVGPILSIIALFYIIMNKEEFKTSETSYLDRIFGVKPAGARPAGVRRAGAGKFPAASTPVRVKAKDVSPRYAEDDYPPPPPPPGEPMMGMKGPAREDTKPEGAGAPRCVACGGTVRSESQGIVCVCGASYHRFCANSISRCRSCGEPI